MLKEIILENLNPAQLENLTIYKLEGYEFEEDVNYFYKNIIYPNLLVYEFESDQLEFINNIISTYATFYNNNLISSQIKSLVNLNNVQNIAVKVVNKLVNV